MRRIPIFILIITVLFPVIVNAQSIEERVTEHRLSNGFKVLMLERHTSPTVALYILFKAGAADEDPDSVGIAHLLEHMLFKGTNSIGTTNFEKEKILLELIDETGTALDAERAKGVDADEGRIQELEQRLNELQEEANTYIVRNEYESWYTRHGAQGFNAATSKDYTLYMIELPSNKVELWAMLESDRLKNYVLRDFYTERQAVLEERRMRVDTNPFGKLSESFLETAFQEHPYGVSIIGMPEDINSLSKEKANRFFADHYTPENGVIIMVGDLVPDEVIPMLEKYFGVIPAKRPAHSSIMGEPKQQELRRVEVQFDAEPSLVIGYHKPTIPHSDNFVFDMIGGILSYGRTSRLYRNIVEKGLALSAYSFNGHPGERYDNLFIFAGSPRAPHTTEELEMAFYEEIERLKHEPVEPSEFERVLKLIDAAFVRALQSNSGMAGWLASSEATAGSWRYMLTWRDEIRKVKPEDVVRVAQSYFTEENRTVGTLVTQREGKKQ
jgi:predicted Zn-dependent peptidase